LGNEPEVYYAASEQLGFALSESEFSGLIMMDFYNTEIPN
jgi:hypothetical protein